MSRYRAYEMAQSDAQRQAKRRNFVKQAAARAAVRCPDIVLVEKQVEDCVAALWSAVIRSGDLGGLTHDCFLESFFAATREEQEGTVKAYRDLLSTSEQRRVDSTMRLMADLFVLARRYRH